MPVAGTLRLDTIDQPLRIIVLNPALEICFLSSTNRQSTDLPDSGLLSQGLWTFLAQVVPSLDAEEIRPTIEEALATGETKCFTHTGISDHGLAWSARVVPMFQNDSLQCIILELQVMAQRVPVEPRSHGELDTGDLFRTLVESVKDYAVFLLDTNGIVMTWNTGAECLKGYTREEVIGKHFCIFYSEEDRQSNRPGKHLVTALRDGKCEVEGWRFRKSGIKFWANVVIRPVFRNDTLIGYCKVTRDLSERKAAESRCISTYEELVKLKEEFLVNTSHEIRTPMHGLLSALTLLRDTSLNTEQASLVAMMASSGNSLLSMINDILDYSRLASGSLSLSVNVICLADIITAVSREARALLSPDVNLETWLDSAIPQNLEGDASRYHQVLRNLVSNAAKFTKHGSIHVKLSLSDRKGDGSVTVLTEVHDSGLGIPEYLVGSLFRPFTQIDSSKTKQCQGVGLGLSLSKKLVELMNGDIGYRPIPTGRGSIFWFTSELLELRRSLDKDNYGSLQHNGVVSEPLTDQLARLKALAESKRLLLAEDNQINREVMLRMLHSLGFQRIDTAADGAQALSLAHRTIDTTEPYDLIFMDISMPKLDGMSVTVRSSSHGPVKIADVDHFAVDASGRWLTDNHRGHDSQCLSKLCKTLHCARLHGVSRKARRAPYPN